MHISCVANKNKDSCFFTPVDSARNIGVILDNKYVFSQHISSISKYCFLNIRDLWGIRNFMCRANASTFASSLILSKIDYCNSLLLTLTQINRL